MDMKGKFIVLEGIDGCGKSTQAKMLFNKMQESEIPAFLTQECSHGPIGMLIRKEFLSGNRKTDPKVTNLLFAADRLDHITNADDGMLGKVNNATNVVCDRYYLSSLAYYAQEFLGSAKYLEELHFIINANMMNKALMTPDITVFIQMDPSEAIKRLNNRTGIKEIYEDIETLKKVYITYFDGIQLLRNLGENIVIIDGNGSADQVHDRIWKAVYPIIAV